MGAGGAFEIGCEAGVMRDIRRHLLHERYLNRTHIIGNTMTSITPTTTETKIRIEALCQSRYFCSSCNTPESKLAGVSDSVAGNWISISPCRMDSSRSCLLLAGSWDSLLVLPTIAVFLSELRFRDAEFSKVRIIQS
jgi:hypothetical protein